MKNNFRLTDIKSGYLVELSNGELYMKMRSNDFDPILINEKDNIIELNKYSGQEYLDKGGFKGKIIAVYGLPEDPRTALMFSKNGRKILYKYEEPQVERGHLNFTFFKDTFRVNCDCKIADLLDVVKSLSKQLKDNNVDIVDIIAAVADGYTGDEEKND